MNDTIDHRINATMDLLHDLLSEAEHRFVEKNLGVRASVPFDLGSFKAMLIYGKANSEWGLFVQLPGSTTLTPILETNMECRIATAFALPALEKALHEAAGIRQLELQRAVDAIEAFLRPKT